MARDLHRSRCGRRLFRRELLGHPFPDPFRDGEFVALGPHLVQLLDQLVFPFVQLRVSRRDPFRDLGLHHEPDRRRRGADERLEPAKAPQPARQTAKTADFPARPA
ncbi:hypothetical protein [Streptomyces sp. CoH27]|uniref:hypothetical protein n=1 Tax=Streptomyces sp. CoH27 TaxID=2875763 RepID=UPI001CD5DE4F|nr:hypothetical protein [Streptomyces sp. CoH27]